MKIVFFLIILSTQVVLGSEEGHTGIPTSVWYQALNFVILLAGLWYLLGAKIKNHFKDRHQTYVELSTLAERKKADMEKSRVEIQNRLNTLEATATSSISKARLEAEQLKKSLVHEAEGLAKKMKEDAQVSERIEVEKAIRSLRYEIVKQALGVAEKDLGEIKGPEQKRLQSEFIEMIQGVVN